MLKKSVLAACLVLVAGSAFAAVTTSPTAPTNLKGFNISKGVGVSYVSGVSNSVYAVGTKHKQGDKCYGGTSASSYVWFKACTAGTDITDALSPDVPDSASDAAVSNGFSSM